MLVGGRTEQLQKIRIQSGDVPECMSYILLMYEELHLT